jgi:hypothetical protein
VLTLSADALFAQGTFAQLNISDIEYLAATTFNDNDDAIFLEEILLTPHYANRKVGDPDIQGYFFDATIIIAILEFHCIRHYFEGSTVKGNHYIYCKKSSSLPSKSEHFLDLALFISIFPLPRGSNNSTRVMLLYKKNDLIIHVKPRICILFFRFPS